MIRMSNLDECYSILGLQPGASLDEVNQAYKDLVFVWHPDRLPQDNPRLVQKAQEKLKEINDARDRLRSESSFRKSTQNGSSQNGGSNHSSQKQEKSQPQPQPTYHHYKPPQSQAQNQAQSQAQSQAHSQQQKQYQADQQILITKPTISHNIKARNPSKPKRLRVNPSLNLQI
jgi:curved DNA-binding protein CbpA